MHLGRNADAATLLEENMSSAERAGDTDELQRLTTQSNLAAVYWELKRRDDAIALMHHVGERRFDLLGRDHPSTQAAAITHVKWQAIHRPGEPITGTSASNPPPPPSPKPEPKKPWGFFGRRKS